MAVLNQVLNHGARRGGFAAQKRTQRSNFQKEFFKEVFNQRIIPPFFLCVLCGEEAAP
jgi:hypothetical protein